MTPLPPMRGSLRTWFRAFVTQCTVVAATSHVPALVRSNAVSSPPPFSWLRFIASHRAELAFETDDAEVFYLDPRLSPPPPGWYYLDATGVYFASGQSWNLVTTLDLPRPPPSVMYFRLAHSRV
jgi:hypothetical protein